MSRVQSHAGASRGSVQGLCQDLVCLSFGPGCFLKTSSWTSKIFYKQFSIFYFFFWGGGETIGLGLLIASANTPWTLPIVDLFEQLCSLCQLRRNLNYCYCITPNITRSISLPYHYKANILLGVLIINHKMVSNQIK